MDIAKKTNFNDIFIDGIRDCIRGGVELGKNTIGDFTGLGIKVSIE